MFIAYAKQVGEGCDYTIGCGRAVWFLDAENREDALLELKKKILGKFYPAEDGGSAFWEEGFWDEQRLSRVLLFKVESETKIPLRDWYLWADGLKQDSTDAANKEGERQEYLRLREIYEG